MSEYKYLGYFAACEPWAAQGMSCDDCKVSWTGCWDNFQCPQCGKGELPSMEIESNDANDFYARGEHLLGVTK